MNPIQHEAKVYMVQHNGVTLDAVEHKLNALQHAASVTSRHPHNPASIITLQRPANFSERAAK